MIPQTLPRPIPDPEDKHKNIPEAPAKKFKSIEELSNIKGIGKKTIDDLKRIYNSVDDLVDALKKDKCPLRDDIVEKLKRELI